jgi:hypothetical protein
MFILSDAKTQLSPRNVGSPSVSPPHPHTSGLGSGGGGRELPHIGQAIDRTWRDEQESYDSRL